MNIEFNFKQLTCCSLELYWNYDNSQYNENEKNYSLYQKDDDEDKFFQNLFGSKYQKIYEGKNKIFEVIDLKPENTYIFKLEIKINNKMIDKKEIKVKMLSAPPALLSENSLQIENGEIILNNKNISDYEKNIIDNCRKLVFEENSYNEIKGNFEGIKIKISHSNNNNNEVFYISFDLEPTYFNEFVKRFIEEFKNNLNLPGYFILNKLPTYLIFNLLEKGSVILTGQRFGGVIGATLALSILYIGKLLKKYYSNSFENFGKNSIGVIMFGSPSFINNGTFALKVREFIPYFYNIKGEFDFIPEIVDFINEDYEPELLNDLKNTLYNLYFLNQVQFLFH